MANPFRNGGVKNESAGPVASDSLAAESVREQGKFGENKNSQPLGVKGSHSTLANTDTSSASKLQAAPDAEARLAEAEWGEGRSQTQAQSQGQTKSLGDEQQQRERQSQGKGSNETSGASSGAAGSGQGDGSGSSLNTAPHYVDPVLGSGQASKPKGKNLKEGGFGDDPARNASFNADIGSKKDPGLQAEKEIGTMSAQNAPGPISKGGPDLMGGSERKTGASYNVLGSEEDA